MVRTITCLIVLLALLGISRADSAKLEQARRAVDDIKFDEARRLLVEAIAEGTHGPGEMRQIYALSAEVAIVLGDRDLGEKFYLRWLAIDRDARLPEGSAPKLRDAFVAAQAQLAASGPLTLRTERTASELTVSIAADPLAMVRTVAIDGAPPQPAPARFQVEASARPRAFARDEHGNTLLETAPLEASVAPVAPPPERPLPLASPLGPRPSFLARWTTWAVPAGAFLIAGAVFGTLATTEQKEANDLLEDSTKHFYRDFERHQAAFERNAKYAIVLGSVSVLFAIPATMFYIRNRRPWELGGIKVAPVLTQRGGGLAIGGAF
ncbi:MAG: hypothetical protein WKG01_33325 [Kofleriaceae bacterium]